MSKNLKKMKKFWIQSSKRFFFILIPICICSIFLSSGALAVYQGTGSGFDWNLSDLPKDHAFITSEDDAYEAVNARLVTLSWNDLEPADDDYQWDIVQNIIADANAGDYKVLLRLKSSVTYRIDPWTPSPPDQFCPQWVLDKHTPLEFYTKNEPENNEIIKVATIWNSGVQMEYQDFVQDFSAQGFLADSRIQVLYIHGISTSFGEEMWMDDTCKDNAVASGMTESLLTDALKARIDYWADNAGNYKKKLCWVTAGWISDYNGVYQTVNDYAATKGIGRRGGSLEATYHGARWIDDVRIDVGGNREEADWNHILLDGTKAIGDEVEQEPFLSSPNDVQTFLHQSGWFKAMCFGASFLWSENSPISFDPDLMQYIGKAMGRTPSDSPDAVVWLREDYSMWYDDLDGDDHGINMSHFVNQYDINSTTIPALRIDLPVIRRDIPDKRYAYTARKGNEFRFWLHDDFRSSMSVPHEVKVTYFDDTVGTWKLKLYGVGENEESDVINNTASGTWKTKSFLFSIKPRGDIEWGDYEIYTIDGSDMTVRFFRVIKETTGVTCSDYNGNQIECEANGCNYCDGTCQSEPCSITIRADVDQNSSINTADAQLTLRDSLGLDMSSTNWQESATTGDVNCDNISNSTDAMLIMRYSLGLSMVGAGWCEN